MPRTRKRKVSLTDERQYLRELIEVSRLYFVEKRTLQEIARMTRRGKNIWPVRQLLDEAERRGIVRLVPHFNLPRLTEHENELIAKFTNLHEAIVVSTSKDSDFYRFLLGNAAADYLDKQMDKSSMKMGLAGGITVLNTMKALPEKKRNIELYPLALFPNQGIVTQVDPIIVMNELLMKSGKKEAKMYFVTVTPFEPGTPLEKMREECKELEGRKQIADMLTQIRSVDLVITSLGAVTPPHAKVEPLGLMEGMGIEKEELTKRKVIGDIGYCFINEKGETPEELDFFLNIRAKVLWNMAKEFPQRKVIVVAGMDEEEPLRAVLRAGLCNVVVTDENTAGKLLED